MENEIKKTSSVKLKRIHSVDNINDISEQSEDSNEDFLETEEFKKMKEELNKGTNFIDYFLTIGLDPEIFNQDWLYNNELDDLNENYKDKLKPKITSYFPPYPKTKIFFDDSIIQHCFPNGFKIISSLKKPKEKLFSFILDNSFYSLDHPKKYLSCLVCYENINQYRLLYKENRNLANEIFEKTNDIDLAFQDIKIDDIKNIPESVTTKNTSENSYTLYHTHSIFGKLKDPNIYIPKCILIISLYPFFSEFERILSNIYDYSLGKIKIESEKNNILNAQIKRTNTKNFDGNTINESLKNNGSEFELKRSSSIREKNAKNIIIKAKDKKFTLYDCFIPIDKFVENLLIELPVPPRGDTNIIYNLMGEERQLIQSKMNQLPLIDVNLKKLFLKFEISEIVDIYRYLFLEARILFFSKNIEILNVFIYGFLALLYPFVYQYQIITLLPKENFEIIESITPFIAGINSKYDSDFFEENNLTLSDSILVVDIDQCEKHLVNEQDTKLPDFPKNYRKNLEKEITNLIFKDEKLKSEINKLSNFKPNNFRESLPINSKINKKESGEKALRNENIRNNSNSTNNNESKFVNLKRKDGLKEFEDIYIDKDFFSNFGTDYSFNKELNEIFYNFNANLLSNYIKFLNLDFYSSNNSPCLEALFKVNYFLKEIYSSEKDFYDKFINETQLFGDYLFMRMVPKNSDEKIRVLLFEEKICSNENLKGLQKLITKNTTPNILTSSKEYDFTNKHKIEKPRELTENEIIYYKKLEHKKLLLSYGIIVKEDKKTNKITFTYPIFPKLTTNIFFKKNMKDYYQNTSLGDNIISINADIISKSHLGGIAERQNDMKNYIDLCWIEMWAMTFWYCDDGEKRYRFQELMKVLSKISSHEMEIFNLVFDALANYGEEYMILKLYSLLLKLRLNPSYKVHSIVMKILDKNKTEGNIHQILKSAIKNEDKIIYEKKNFRKRTFKSKYYKNIFSEDILFFAFDTCIFCENQTVINLETASNDFINMKRELMWMECPVCKNPFLPKISLQFGKEINKIGKMKYNTSKIDSIVLFSPYFLKSNYNNSLLKDFGIHVDVEELMLKYNNIFWDSIWYFKLNGLEYDFMLPYEKTYDNEKYNSNIEINTSDIYEKLHEFKIQSIDQVYI